MISQQSMSLYELLSLIISACGLVVSFAGFTVVCVSLFYLSRQTRELTNQTTYVANSLIMSAYNSLSSPIFEVDGIFINHPELRPYFYSGKEIHEDNPDYNRVISIAEFLLDTFDIMLVNTPYLQHPLEYGNIARRYIIDSFANSPILCKYHESAKEWYVAEQGELKRLGEIQRQNSNK